MAGTPLLFDVGNGYTGVHLIMVIKLYVCFVWFPVILQ